MAKLVKFSQPNCRGCTVMDNIINEVEPAIEVIKIDISTHPDFVSNYDLTGVPTMIVFDENEVEIKRHVGTMTEEEFEAWLK